MNYSHGWSWTSWPYPFLLSSGVVSSRRVSLPSWGSCGSSGNSLVALRCTCPSLFMLVYVHVCLFVCLCFECTVSMSGWYIQGGIWSGICLTGETCLSLGRCKSSLTLPPWSWHWSLPLRLVRLASGFVWHILLGLFSSSVVDTGVLSMWYWYSGFLFTKSMTLHFSSLK